MINHHSVLELKTEARQQFIDVTDWVQETVRQVGLGQGIATVFTQHTSCCVLLQEESEDVTYWNVQYILQDTLNALQQIVPPARHEGQYLHPGPVHIRNAAELRGEEPAWGLNTDGHIIGSLLGRVQVVPVTDDELTLGEFGRLYFGDLDSTRPRERKLRVHLLGRVMLIYAVDLGTTNLKVALYDEGLRRLALSSKAVSYDTRRDRVEFDPQSILADVIELIGQCAAESGIETRPHRAVIVLTGQAESLVLAGADLAPVRPGISWLDSRASLQSAEIEAEFTAGEGFRITGQPFPAAAWPASKLRWLARHEPRSLDAARHVLMIKDYVQLSLTGVAAGESSTRAFSYFYDVTADAYWPAMLDFCTIEPAKLPPIIAPGTTVGPVSASMAAALPPAAGYTVNAGTLDHFASMAGAGSYSDSVVSESSGTVLSLSFIAPDWKFDPSVLVSFHRGLRRQDMVCFDCADSGGVCLDWFKNNFYGTESYDWLESRLTARVHAPDAPLFLPYLTGLNPPEYFKEAAGAFVELTLRHDGIDMAYAVMEGVAHLLRSNIDYCEAHLLGEVKGIVSTGGGSASAFWSQLKADACHRTIVVPIETQSVCRGAAVIGLVEAGVLAGVGEAESLAPVSTKVYTPSRDAVHRARYERFQQLRDLLYANLTPLSALSARPPEG